MHLKRNDCFFVFVSLMLLNYMLSFDIVDFVIFFCFINKISAIMLDWHRSYSAEFPRQKIYLSSLSQLMERKVVVQP